MKVEIIGKKSGSFTNKDGEYIEFGKLHCVGDFSMDESGTNGKSCYIISCKPKYLVDIPVPCFADVQFNQYGRLAGVNILSEGES